MGVKLLKGIDMAKWILAFGLILSVFFVCGCVERELTVNSVPSGATVVLNDEEIGQTPVTVSFNWYGDYRVRLVKSGYETLSTHRELERPWYDKFPADFFAQFMWPKRINDSYTWDFALKEYAAPSRVELIKSAEIMRAEVDSGQMPAVKKK
jgi:hypothetical protein